MEQNHNMLRGISENGGIVFYGVDSTEIVREMERLHKTSAVTTAALGRLLTAASMMGIMLKSTRDSVTLQIKGGGPAGRLLAVSDGTVNVKGSRTPSMVVNSCTTPSILTLVTATPGREDRSTRRKLLPKVVPKPRSRGSTTNLP
jgi:redox-regulated HSP33 family molecular chaperone